MERTKDKFLEEQEKDAQISNPFSFLFDAYYFSGYTANTRDNKEDLDEDESK